MENETARIMLAAENLDRAEELLRQAAGYVKCESDRQRIRALATLVRGTHLAGLPQPVRL